MTKQAKVLPAPLWIEGGINYGGFKGYSAGISYSNLGFGGPVATVFEDPSIDTSDVEITRTASQELTIWGTGFNHVASPVMDFDPTLDWANVNVTVSGQGSTAYYSEGTKGEPTVSLNGSDTLTANYINEPAVHLFSMTTSPFLEPSTQPLWFDSEGLVFQAPNMDDARSAGHSELTVRHRKSAPAIR